MSDDEETPEEAPREVPAHLGEPGRALWESVIPAYELTPSEEAILVAAAGIADTIAGLEDEWHSRGRPWTGKGVAGQEVIHPLVGEIRGQRNTLKQLLTSLRLPHPDEADEEKPDRLDFAAHGRKGAEKRWGPRKAVQ